MLRRLSTPLLAGLAALSLSGSALGVQDSQETKPKDQDTNQVTEPEYLSVTATELSKNPKSYDGKNVEVLAVPQWINFWSGFKFYISDGNEGDGMKLKVIYKMAPSGSSGDISHAEREEFFKELELRIKKEIYDGDREPIPVRGKFTAWSGTIERVVNADEPLENLVINRAKGREDPDFYFFKDIRNPRSLEKIEPEAIFNQHWSSGGIYQFVCEDDLIAEPDVYNLHKIAISGIPTGFQLNSHSHSFAEGKLELTGSVLLDSPQGTRNIKFTTYVTQEEACAWADCVNSGQPVVIMGTYFLTQIYSGTNVLEGNNESIHSGGTNFFPYVSDLDSVVSRNKLSEATLK